MASSMSTSVGLRVACQQRRGDMICPDWHVAALDDFMVKPGLLNLWSLPPSARSPRRRDLRLANAVDRYEQERRGDAVDMDGAAPHSAMPQPNFVPVHAEHVAPGPKAAACRRRHRPMRISVHFDLKAMTTTPAAAAHNARNWSTNDGVTAELGEIIGRWYRLYHRVSFGRRSASKPLP